MVPDTIRYAPPNLTQEEVAHFEQENADDEATEARQIQQQRVERDKLAASPALADKAQKLQEAQRQAKLKPTKLQSFKKLQAAKALSNPKLCHLCRYHA